MRRCRAGALVPLAFPTCRDLIEGRRRNGALFQSALGNHPDLRIQRETGASSWFGFSLVIKPESRLNRKTLVTQLNAKGFECRPIVSGNFAKNEVLKHFDHSIHGTLENADYIDQNGLFIGNHHYPIEAAIEALRDI